MPEDAVAPAEPTSTSVGETQNTTSTPSNSGVSSETGSPGSSEPSWFNALDEALSAEEKSQSDTNGAADESKSDDSEKQSSEESGDEAAVKNMTPSAGAKFKEIKAEAKAARARVAELESRLAELENSPKPDAVEAEKLQAAIAEREAKISEYEKELAISRFEATEEYKESVVAPMAAIIGVVEDLAKEYEISEKALLSILEEPNHKKQGEMIAEIASNFSERDRFSLYQLGDDYAAVLEQRDKLRSRASEALAAREKAKQTEEARRVEESRKSWAASTKSVWDTFKTKIPLPEDPQRRESFEKEVVTQVTNVDFDKLSYDHKAFAAYAGAVIPEVVKQNKALSAEINELKTALKKYQNATPGAGVGGDIKPQEVDASVGFLDALEKRFASV